MSRKLHLVLNQCYLQCYLTTLRIDSGWFRCFGGFPAKRPRWFSKKKQRWRSFEQKWLSRWMLCNQAIACPRSMKPLHRRGVLKVDKKRHGWSGFAPGEFHDCTRSVFGFCFKDFRWKIMLFEQMDGLIEQKRQDSVVENIFWMKHHKIAKLISLDEHPSSGATNAWAQGTHWSILSSRGPPWHALKSTDHIFKKSLKKSWTVNVFGYSNYWCFLITWGNIVNRFNPHSWTTFIIVVYMMFFLHLVTAESCQVNCQDIWVEPRSSVTYAKVSTFLAVFFLHNLQILHDYAAARMDWKLWDVSIFPCKKISKNRGRLLAKLDISGIEWFIIYTWGGQWS